MIKKATLILPLLALGAGAAFMATSSCSKSTSETSSEVKDKAPAVEKKDGPLKVLYVTHEPGTYHRYTPQRKIFEELAKQNNWQLDVLSGSHDDVEEILATTPDFAQGADVVVYNFCMAHAKKLEAPFNIIQTTKEQGTPALLVHCSLHSFWSTYKSGDQHIHGQPAQVKAPAELIAEWKTAHPNDDFPAWSSFTGIASTAHGARAPLDTKMLQADHEIFNGFEDYTTTDKAELYNNFVKPEDSPKTAALLQGQQGSNKSVVLWEHPVGKSKTVSFTLGHDTAEWSQPQFQTLITNSVNYLGKDRK